RPWVQAALVLFYARDHRRVALPQRGSDARGRTADRDEHRRDRMLGKRAATYRRRSIDEPRLDPTFFELDDPHRCPTPHVLDRRMKHAVDRNLIGVAAEPLPHR